MFAFKSTIKNDIQPFKSQPIHQSSAKFIFNYRFLFDNFSFLVFYIRFYSSSDTNDVESYLFQSKIRIFSVALLFSSSNFDQIHTEQKFVSAFTHTKPIGIFKVDVSTVYNEREHAFEKKWAQLVDPNSIKSNCGHLLLSVLVSEHGVASKVKSNSLDKKTKLFFLLLKEYSW